MADRLRAWLTRNQAGGTAVVLANRFLQAGGYLHLYPAGSADPVAVFAPGGWDAITEEPGSDVTARFPWVKPPAEAARG
jgi:hypothetical protein